MKVETRLFIRTRKLIKGKGEKGKGELIEGKYSQSTFYTSKKRREGWSRGSAAENSCCSWRGPEFGS